MAMMLIDKTKDSACKSAEADVIRAKTGGSAQIAYDWANNKGFADAIAAIPSGGGGLNVDKKTVTRSSASAQMTVDREFTDFIFLAFLKDTPTTIPTNGYALAQMAIYINGKFWPSNGTGKSYLIKQDGTTAAKFIGFVGNNSQFAVGPTSITWTAYTSHNLVVGDWTILQIEIPASLGMYSMADAAADINGV